MDVRWHCGIDGPFRRDLERVERRDLLGTTDLDIAKRLAIGICGDGRTYRTIKVTAL